jgi:hypothetical protein
MNKPFSDKQLTDDGIREDLETAWVRDDYSQLDERLDNQGDFEKYEVVTELRVDDKLRSGALEMWAKTVSNTIHSKLDIQYGGGIRALREQSTEYRIQRIIDSERYRRNQMNREWEAAQDTPVAPRA